MARMRNRWLGAACGALVGVVVALLPLGDSWEIHAFTIIPGGTSAAVGAVVAGYLISPLVGSRPSALGAVALRFGVMMFLVSLPLVALDSAILASRPIDEPWPLTLGPLG